MHKWMRWIGILQMVALGLYAAIANYIWQDPFYWLGMPLFILLMAKGFGIIILSRLFPFRMGQPMPKC
ncbi:hypothetical protein [Paenibacillus sp. Leaf72]|uniref:hypothetical protein n=1 Tax=Paenibacillus sp. Leaf72 TaxID=1736234 RepID=UPI000B2E422E|nr:hypothetical protein [Paenibacillus sp. Leaf72]